MNVPIQLIMIAVTALVITPLAIFILWISRNNFVSRSSNLLLSIVSLIVLLALLVPWKTWRLGFLCGN